MHISPGMMERAYELIRETPPFKGGSYLRQMKLSLRQDLLQIEQQITSL